MTDERTRAVEQLLKKYTVIKTYINNLHAELEDYQALQQLSPAPAVQSLSHAPGSNGKISSQEERQCITKEAMPERIAEIQAKLVELETLMKRLDKSLEALTDTDRRIIEARYINGYSWTMVARYSYSSEGYCRKRIGKVIEILADMMFGVRGIMMQTKLFIK